MQLIFLPILMTKFRRKLSILVALFCTSIFAFSFIFMEIPEGCKDEGDECWQRIS